MSTPPAPPGRRRRRRAIQLVVAGLAVIGFVALGIALGMRGSHPKQATGPPLPTGNRPIPCPRPYAASSPWNQPIPANARSLTSKRLPAGFLSSDPTQYTYPVYTAPARLPAVTVRIDGVFSNVTGPTRLSRELHTTVRVPIPKGAQESAGSDGQLIVLRPSTGDEWGFWQLHHTGSGWEATNGYHYNTRWSGVPPAGFGSRGAGMTYLAGLIRPCEIARGEIDHAIAFAYNYPSPAYVYPARKSDGSGDAATAFPEGTRLQLDPSLTDTQLAALGIKNDALVVAHALQKYGMFVVDNSGRAKIYFEDDRTARWLQNITADTVRPIPLSDFRAVAPVNGELADGGSRSTG
jgi:hypothetical protein